jgi:hypothetical protein
MERLQMRNDGENIIIKMSSPEMVEKVMRVFNYANVLEIMKDVDVPQEEIDKLANEVNASMAKKIEQRVQVK